jgi:hypothetical protein
MKDISMSVESIGTFQIFGSKSSKDYDVLFFVDELKSIKENHDLIKMLNTSVKKFLIDNGQPDKPVNTNLGILNDGKLITVFKGTYDEVNNSLFYTYTLHTQFYPNRITSTYDRTSDFFKHLKLKRCYRFLLSFYSRTELRSEIKGALKGNFKLRWDVLSKIDLRTWTQFPEKKDDLVDIYKVMAFQLAQTIELFSGVEIYTKEDALIRYPELHAFLLREPHDSFDLYYLNVHLVHLLKIGFIERDRMHNLEEEILGQ